MESIQLDQDSNSTEEPYLEQLILTSSPEISGVFGEPHVNPRVGDEYQVEVPSMISDPEHLELLISPLDSEDTEDVPFVVGLPVPVVWINNVTNNRDDQGCKCKRNPDDIHNATGGKPGKIKNINTLKKKKKKKKKGSELHIETSSSQMEKEKESTLTNAGLKFGGEVNDDRSCGSKNYSAVPGSSNGPWTDAEIGSFILGLYIFGKNFVQIKRFMDQKEMGDILSFYYGQFYSSDAYRRWSDNRKAKRKKCVTGQKLFTGWRLQELLSRLHPHVPEHLQNNFLEVAKAFKEGQFSLEDYVANLKDAVSIEVLVEAIGIGKGKEDLTGLAMETIKSNPLSSICSAGKAFSSLTSSDIIRLLNGGCRLSKARCNDIFWEAVWPRLLARGWHSEQSKSKQYVDSKSCLVFLIPGVKSFSRRKLEKGNHYFDSVSDVLSKVASEPELLEIEAVEVRNSSCGEEDGSAPGLSSDQDGPSVKQPHQYLKPRVSNCNLKLVSFNIVDSSLVHEGKLSEMRELRYSADDMEVKPFLSPLSSRSERIVQDKSLENNELDDVDMKLDVVKNVNNTDCGEGTCDSPGSNLTQFVIMDTSLINGGKSSKVTELRCLPGNLELNYEMADASTKTESDSLEDAQDKHALVSAKMPRNGGRNANKSKIRKIIFKSSASGKICGNSLNSVATNTLAEGSQYQENVLTEYRPRTIKHHFSRRAKNGRSDEQVPVVKRRRLIACSNTEISHAIEYFSVDLRSKQLEACGLNSPEENSNVVEVNPFQLKSPQGSQEEEGRGGMDIPDAAPSPREKAEHQTAPQVDLKLSHVPLHSENGEPPVMMDMENNQAVNTNNACIPSNSSNLNHEGSGTSNIASLAAEQPNMNLRRQSTRNRNMSTRALEALESGFLDVKMGKSYKIPVSNPSRNASSKSKVTSVHSITVGTEIGSV